MVWSAERTRRRITADMERLPKVKVSDVQTLRRDMRESRDFAAKAHMLGASASTVSIPRNRAVLSDTVQAYIQIHGVSDIRRLALDGERSDNHALGFLHDLYATSDRLIDRTDFQRVDYHAARIHLVVMAENGKRIEASDVRDAIAAVEAIRAAAQQVAYARFGHRVSVSSSAGIDVGHCLAINNGSGDEQEPLFIGSAANHAAKLAQSSPTGIRLTARAQRRLYSDAVPAQPPNDEPVYLAESTARNIAVAKFQDRTFERYSTEDSLTRAVKEAVQKGRAYVRAMSHSGTGHESGTEFQFFYQSPPMKALKYRDLMPSRTLRHSTINIFADICGYTAFVDACIANGTPETAVRALYIIRNELKAVLQDDFGGRKLRFIGDCIQGFTAIEQDGAIHPQNTVASGVRIANAMLDSLKICKAMLGGVDELELSIGIELGDTPISRLGLRGDRSVRATSCVAAEQAEALQHDCAPGQFKLGQEALRHAPAGTFDFVSSETGLGQLQGYIIANSLLGEDIFEPQVPAVHTRTWAVPVVSPEPAPPPRAYLGGHG